MHTITPKRQFLLNMAIVLGSLLLPVAGAHAQSAWPNKVIRIFVGFAPGGPTDIVARTFANRLSAELGQQVIVENKPGAGGTLAATAVAKAPPDGYTLLLGEPGSMAVNPAQMPPPPYDPLKDFVAVGQVVSLPMVLVASPSLKVTSLKELLAIATSKPLAFGTPGNGTMQHLTMAEFGKVNHVQFTHVAYRGGAPAITDLLGGQIPLAMVTVPSVAPYVKSGGVVPLAVVAAKRSAQLPQTQTFIEAGFPAFVQDGWQGFFAPAQTPRDIVARLNAAIQKVGNTPELQSAMAAIGANVVLSSQTDFASLLLRDAGYWAKVVAENPGAKD
jgi:tripartite-type tricarboxylate transporter receptor subunit TctC